MGQAGRSGHSLSKGVISMRIISIASQKGGTGKTTTAAALGCWAAEHGLKTLCMDLDPQGSLTHILQGNGNEAGAYEIMKGTPVGEVIQVREGLPDIIPASLQLAGADAEYSGKPGRDFLLKKALEPLAKEYGLIVLDTPPTLGTLLVNALTASDSVVIPVQADTFAMQSVFQLMDTISQVQQYCNQGLTVAGVLLTRYNGRTVLSRDHREDIAERCEGMRLNLFTASISEGIAVKEAQTLQRSLFRYAPKSRPALDYAGFMSELGIGGEN